MGAKVWTLDQGAAAGGWEDESGGSQPVQVVTARISSAQFLQLFTTPIQLVAAPGVGKVVVPLSFTGLFTFGTTPYVDGDGEQIGWASSFASTQITGAAFDSTMGSSNGGYATPTQAPSLAPGDFENQPLVVGCITTDPTGGDGTAVVSILYSILPVT